MLQGNVEIGKHWPGVLDGLEQLLRYPLGVEVEQAQPEEAVEAGKLPDKRRQPLLAGMEVLSVIREVLGDEVEFPDACGQQGSRLGDDVAGGS